MSPFQVTSRAGAATATNRELVDGSRQPWAFVAHLDSDEPSSGTQLHGYLAFPMLDRIRDQVPDSLREPEALSDHEESGAALL
jgi:hypothetical protein